MTYFDDMEAAIVARLATLGGEWGAEFGPEFSGSDAEYTVTQTGATVPYPFVQEEALIQIDTRSHTSKKKARDAAYAARDSLLTWRDETPGTTPRVSVISGPFWLPEPDGEPRYVMTVAVTHRAHAAAKEAAHG